MDFLTTRGFEVILSHQVATVRGDIISSPVDIGILERYLTNSAREEARVLQQNSIDSAHILLALLKVEGNPVVDVLHRAGLTRDNVRAALAYLGYTGLAPVTGDINSFSPRARRLLESVLSRAIQHDLDGVGYLKLLLTDLIDVDEGGSVMAVLQRLAIDPNKILAQLTPRSTPSV